MHCINVATKWGNRSFFICEGLFGEFAWSHGILGDALPSSTPGSAPCLGADSSASPFLRLLHEQLKHIMGNITFVLMHSGIVNGCQLLCDAHTVLEPHVGTAVFFSF